MDQIEKIKEELRIFFYGEFSGHDYWHSFRVYRTAMVLAEGECCDRLVVALASLLHDVDDDKIFDTYNYANARLIMRNNGIKEDVAEKVISTISMVSFRDNRDTTPATIEGKIVQDADRLDALGAIGIARVFAYGGSHNRPLYNPEEKNEDYSRDNYGKNSSLGHFYEKILLLKSQMNTDIAKRMAEKRDLFVREFLEKFMCEWSGNDSEGQYNGKKIN